MIFPKGTRQGPSDTITKHAEGTEGPDNLSLEADIKAYLDAKEKENPNDLPKILATIKEWTLEAEER